MTKPKYISIILSHTLSRKSDIIVRNVQSYYLNLEIMVSRSDQDPIKNLVSYCGPYADAKITSFIMQITLISFLVSEHLGSRVAIAFRNEVETKDINLKEIKVQLIVKAVRDVKSSICRRT